MSAASQESAPRSPISSEGNDYLENLIEGDEADYTQNMSGEDLLEDESGLPFNGHSSQEEFASGGSVSDLEAFSDSDVEGGGKTTPNQLSSQAKKPPRDERLQVYDELSDAQSSCLNFAMEHRIFLKAILALLAERDKKATEIGMNDPNTLKSGPLKKASHLVSGVWKVKFVEVRRGMFSYYEDAISGSSSESLLRKNLPLDANTCSCRPVKIHRNGLNMTTSGAIFELKIGNSRRLWLAKTRAERLAWIQAINDAMVGGSVTQGNIVDQHGKSGRGFRRSPYQKDLKKYLKTKSNIKHSTTKNDYVTALSSLVGDPFDIPVQWLMEQVDMPQDEGVGAAFQEKEVMQGVEQLWRDLQRDTLRINSELFHGDSGHGPEKMIGSLARNIVAFSHSTNSTTRYRIPESRAIAYARDILLSVNRTRSGGDSYFCIDTLCKNPELALTVPSSREAKPLSISVEIDDSEDPSDYSINDKSGWIRTRNRIQVSWRRRFFVLSEGTLSLYRNASPRPHGLRGQMSVTGASIVVDKSKEHPGYYAISIEAKDGRSNRWLYFNNKFKLLQWAYALELASKGTSMPASGMVRFGLRSPRDSKQDAKSDDQQMIETNMIAHAEQIGVSREEFDERVARYSAKNNSRVKVSVEAFTEYNICTTDPQGDGEDMWATVGATFMQTFRIGGDRIARGEETVHIEVSRCLDPAVSAGSQEGPSTEILSPKRKLGDRLRRVSTG